MKKYKENSFLENVEINRYVFGKTTLYIAEIKSNLDDNLVNKTTKSRKAEILKYRLKKDRDLMIVGDILASHYLPNDAKFCLDDNLKPYLLNYNIKFNKSHSEKIVAVAIADTYVGVDVQYHDIFNFNDIAERYFSEKEKYQFNNSINKEKFFFDTWAKKESYVKMLGIGIAKPDLSTLKYENCNFHTIEYDDDYSICLAIKEDKKTS